MQLQEPNADVAQPLVPISASERARIPSSLPQDMSQQAAAAIESLKGEDPKVVPAISSRAGVQHKSISQDSFLASVDAQILQVSLLARRDI